MQYILNDIDVIENDSDFNTGIVKNKKTGETLEYKIDKTNMNYFLNNQSDVYILDKIPTKYYLIHYPRLFSDIYLLFKGKKIDNTEYPGTFLIPSSTIERAFNVDIVLFVNDYIDTIIDEDYYWFIDRKNKCTYTEAGIYTEDGKEPILVKTSAVAMYSADYTVEEFDEMNLDIIVYLNIKYDLNIHDDILDLI